MWLPPICCTCLWDSLWDSLPKRLHILITMPCHCDTCSQKSQVKYKHTSIVQSLKKELFSSNSSYRQRKQKKRPVGKRKKAHKCSPKSRSKQSTSIWREIEIFSDRRMMTKWPCRYFEERLTWPLGTGKGTNTQIWYHQTHTGDPPIRWATSRDQRDWGRWYTCHLPQKQTEKKNLEVLKHKTQDPEKFCI